MSCHFINNNTLIYISHYRIIIQDLLRGIASYFILPQRKRYIRKQCIILSDTTMCQYIRLALLEIARLNLRDAVWDVYYSVEQKVVWFYKMEFIVNKKCVNKKLTNPNKKKCSPFDSTNIKSVSPPQLKNSAIKIN